MSKPLDEKGIAVREAKEDQMSEEELALHFNQKPPEKKEDIIEKLPSMNPSEVIDWEKQQDNSNDIYKVSARVKNIARNDGRASLTNVGEMLCNTYVHVLKSFYDFAENVKDKDTKEKLLKLIRKNEDMPGNFIAAINSGVKNGKTK